MNYLDYREKLGIGFDNRALRQYFLTRMQNFFKGIRFDSMNISYELAYDYFNIVGEDIDSIVTDDELLCITEDIGDCSDLKEFIARYITFLNLLHEENDGVLTRQNLLDVLKYNLEEARIPYEIVTDEDGLFLFPKGAPEMDAALVSQPLSWLADYPKAHTAYVKALKEYSEATPDNASDIADKFRKTLETFFQEFFGCDKTLENCKALYGAYLKSRNVPKEIAGNLETLLQTYTTFINAYAKHHDKTGVNILEYLMYQTGNIIRLLITLKQEEKESAD